MERLNTCRIHKKITENSAYSMASAYYP